MTAALTVRAEAGESCRSLFDDRWDELVRSQPLPNPTLSATWLRHLLEWEAGQPLAIVVERDGALVAAGAFGLHRPAGRRGPKVARWLGDDRQWFSPELLVDSGTPAAGEALVDALLGLADVVHVPAAEHGPTLAALRARVPWSRAVPGAEDWTAPLPPPRLQHALARFRRDMRRAARRGVEVGARVATAPDEAASVLERLFLVHADRWRRLGGEIPRFSTTEAHRAWYRGVVAAFAARGEVVLVEVLEDGEPVAAELAFLAGRGAALHTTAVRPGAGLDEPGRASQIHLLSALEQTGIEVFDLGCGAGGPGTPKAALGPTRVLVQRVLAAESRLTQHALAAALAIRDRRQRRQR